MAQEADTRDAVGGSSEIVVTARRRGESLQDVPQTITAVTDETISKLNLQNLKDIQNVVPGLQLAGGNSGFDSGFSLRGISYTTLDQVPAPTVVFYVNDVVADSNLVFQSLFDVGQIEVLRGPQGTLRGRSAPAGAITITPRRPQLDSVDGYVDLTGTERGNINANAGIGVPIIPGVLAVRVAAIVDQDELNAIRSVNNGVDPFKDTEALRGTVRFEPTDWIEATVMYQKLWSRNQQFTQVFGAGSPGAPAFGLPQGFNGPVIDPADRLSVSEQPTTSKQLYEILTANASVRFAGQKLSYIYGFTNQEFRTVATLDPFNAFPNRVFNFDAFQDIATGSKSNSHELRLSSEERLFGVLDYTIGGYYQRATGVTDGDVGPGTPFFVTLTSIDQRLASTEYGAFGNATVHIGTRTEISGGVRHIWYKSAQDPTSSICTLIPAFGLTVCQPQTPPVKDQHWVYSGSASHRLTDDLLVFANIGTSYRPPFSLVFSNPLSAPGFQSATDLVTKTAGETSRGIEVGFKSTFLDRRGRLNLTLFHQKYKNTSVRTGVVNYLNLSNPFAPQIAQDQFTSTNDAKVKGFDVDAGFQFTPKLNANVGFSWAKSNVSNQPVPCNDSNFDGVPDTGTPTVAAFQAARLFVARCLSRQSLSRAPRYSITGQAEYAHPISDAVDVFLRGNVSYQPKNRNQSREAGVVIDDYTLLDLFTGIRAPDGDWEVSLFGRNLLKTSQILSQSVPGAAVSGIAVGYTAIGYTAPREFGLNVRYRFGTR